MHLLPEGQWYKGRALGVHPLNCSVETEAFELLTQFVPTRKAYGRFLSRLLYEHAARREERARMRRVLEETDVDRGLIER